MIWFVDIEHEKVLADPQLVPDHNRWWGQGARFLGEVAGEQCQLIPYRQVSRERAEREKLRAIAISGNVTDWEEYDFSTFQPLFDLVRSGTIPTIGFCGGHQLLGLMYGAECGPLRRLNPGEVDPGGFAPGWYKELGYQPVRVVHDDPLFAGLGGEPVFFESHYWQVRQVPVGFELLASTSDCRVQAIRHKQFIIYGTQFHPEVNDAEHPDGMKLVENFFKIAGVLK